ncbi:MAG: hypothetical protein HY929_00415 [Euryarchaeota archaeon]|nr:hypothetical protein [Euryarchaeota archaeon]
MRTKKINPNLQTKLTIQNYSALNEIETETKITEFESTEIPNEIENLAFLPILKKECKRCGSSFATHFESVEFCANCIKL